MPTLPPVAGTQNAVVHAASGGPSVSDLGLAGNFSGGVITNLQTSFPFTQDTYNDLYQQPQVDVLYGFGLEITFDWEVHLKSTGMTDGVTPADGATPSTWRPGIILSDDAVGCIALHDTRGFGTGTGTSPGTLWANGTKFIVSDLSGTFERQKLRKDKVKLAFRRYATS